MAGCFLSRFRRWAGDAFESVENLSAMMSDIGCSLREYR